MSVSTEIWSVVQRYIISNKSIWRTGKATRIILSDSHAELLSTLFVEQGSQGSHLVLINHKISATWDMKVKTMNERKKLKNRNIVWRNKIVELSHLSGLHLRHFRFCFYLYIECLQKKTNIF